MEDMYVSEMLLVPVPFSPTAVIGSIRQSLKTWRIKRLLRLGRTVSAAESEVSSPEWALSFGGRL